MNSYFSQAVEIKLLIKIALEKNKQRGEPGAEKKNEGGKSL